jgi:hypothetical protein
MRKVKPRPYRPPPTLSKAEIAEIDALLKKHRDQQRRELPADIAFYNERRDSGRTCKQACSDLLRSGIPSNRGLRLLAGLHLLEGGEQEAWQEAWDVEGTLVLDIARHVQLVTGLLRAAGHKQARNKAAEHAASHWRGVRKFASGAALLKWLWNHERDDAL